jgi:hypothetical protein
MTLSACAALASVIKMTRGVAQSLVDNETIIAMGVLVCFSKQNMRALMSRELGHRH